MKYSQLFGKTEKLVPQEMKAASHRLLFQGGFVRESTAGRYYFLPLGLRVRSKIVKIVKEEMDNAGAQELITPVLHPLELWEETNRTSSVGFELMTIKDRRGAQFALGGTAEEMMIDLVRKYQLSYKDLPFNIYQFSQKFRDEFRARGGLLRVREFLMKDAYSFNKDETDFKKEYENMWQTYKRIFDRLGLPTNVVESDNGYIGGEYCHEFVVESEAGESKFLVSEGGNYSAHEDVALFKKEDKNSDEALKELQVVEAKRGTTMEDGVKFHGLPLWQQIKDVLYKDETGRFVLAIIRGDFDVNETKLKHIIKVNYLEMATEDDVRNLLHSEPGFISPIGIKDNMEKNVKLIIIADDSLRTVKNTYGGANKLNMDSLNMNIDRDYKADIEGDIALAKDGFVSLDGQKLHEKKGIEVGNIFQLGYHYTNKMKGSVFVDKDGEEKPYYMGCYGIGVDRTMATVVEAHHDDKGIVWPKEVAPMDIHLISLVNENDNELLSKAENIYNMLQEAGYEVLWDERQNVTAGEKFADADLIGLPIRLVISKKSLSSGGIEMKARNSSETQIITEPELIQGLGQL